MQEVLNFDSHFKPAARATLSLTNDFWPASNLDEWRIAPRESFRIWLSEKHVIGNQGFRESSFETYLAMFSSWLKFLEERNLDLLEAQPKDADLFFTGHTLEPVSRRRYLQILDKVYLHFQGLGWEGSHPFREELAKERLLSVDWPKGLGSAELIRLIKYLLDSPGWKGVRDRAILALTVGAGLRNNELVSLKRSALDLGPDHTIHVVPSGIHRPHDTVVLPATELEDTQTKKIHRTFWVAWIAAWHKVVQEQGIPGDWAIPSTKSGTAYSASGVFRRIQQWFDGAGIQPEQGGVNVLRNTFAHLAIKSGRYSATQIQEFLGHEQSRATERYLLAALRRARPPSGLSRNEG